MKKMQEQEEEKATEKEKERSRKEIKEEQRESKILLEKRGIYIHIPFCKQKCLAKFNPSSDKSWNLRQREC